MSKWEQLKDIKGLLTAIFGFCAVAIAIGGYVMNLTINTKVATAVAAELAKQDLGTDSKIVAMDAVAAENARTGVENAEDIAENKQAVRDAFQILMTD